MNSAGAIIVEQKEIVAMAPVDIQTSPRQVSSFTSFDDHVWGAGTLDPTCLSGSRSKISCLEVFEKVDSKWDCLTTALLCSDIRSTFGFLLC